MPDPTNPFPPGTPEHQRYEELMAAQAASSGGGGGANLQPLPQGAQPTGKPGQYVMQINVPNGTGGTNKINEIYTVNDKGQVIDVDRSASGVGYSQGASGGGSGGSNTNFAAQNAQNKQAIQDKGGAMAALPPRAVEYAPGRAYWHPQGYATGSVLQFNPETQRWVNSGYSPSTAERGAITRAIAMQGPEWNAQTPQSPGATAQTPQQSAMVARPPMPNDPNTRTQYLPGSVNNVAIQNPNTGFSGFLNPSTGQRAPANIGFGPATGANQILFSQNERGFSQAENPIRASFTTPLAYDPLTGLTNNAFAGTTIGVTPGGFSASNNEAFDPFAPQAPGQVTVPINLAGNNVQFSAPDKSWGTGFALNALPHSNIALAQGRDFSNLTPAQQAVANFMLLDEQMKGAMSGAYRTGDGAYIFGGGGGDFDVGMRSAVGGTYTYDPFVAMAGGGRVAVSPLAGQRGGPRELITNEPMLLVGANSGRVRGLVGEDNADMDMRPDRELLSFRNNQMHVTPLDPPVAMAEGGTVTAAPATTRYWKDLNDGSVFENSGGIDYTGPGVIEVGDIYGNPIGGTPTPTPTPTPQTPTPTNPNTPVALPIDNGGVQPPAPGSQPLPEPEDTFDPFSGELLTPFQSALNRLGFEENMRDRYQYRRTAGGLGREQGITILDGAPPGTAPPPGTFWDMRPQVENSVAGILGNRQALRELGPDEDINPIQERVTFLGTVIEDLDRIRDLQFQRIGALASGDVPSANSGNVASWTAQLGTLNEQLGAYYEGWRVNPASKSIEAQREVNNMERKVRELESLLKEAEDKGVTSLDRTSIIDATIRALQEGLPIGASEAGARTELARLQERIGRHDKRQQAKTAIKNIALAGVPSLTAPIVPVDPFAKAAA